MESRDALEDVEAGAPVDEEEMQKRTERNSRDQLASNNSSQTNFR
jgi:hypothetical protein